MDHVCSVPALAMPGFDTCMYAACSRGQAARWTTGEQVNEPRLICGDTGTEPGSLDSLDQYGLMEHGVHTRSLGACWQQSVQQPASMLLSSCVHVPYGGRQRRPAQRNNLMPTPAALSTTWRLIILLESVLHSSHLPLADPFCLSSSDLASKRRTR